MADRFKIMLGICFVLIVLVLGTVWVGVKASHGDRQVTQINQLFHAQQMIAAREECRAAVQSRFNEVIRERDAIGWSAIPDLIGYHLGDPAAQIASLIATRDRLAKANEAVLALPSLDAAVNHGFDLAGVHYPACPKVPR
jgi:hypothetical protein